MSRRKSFRIILLSLATGMLGCVETRGAPSSSGAIQFEVRPEDGASPNSGARGTFSVRGVDNAYHVRVPLAGDAYQSLRVPVPAGSYWLDWELEVFDDAVDQFEPEAGQHGPYMVVVAPAQVTTIDVRSHVFAGCDGSVALNAVFGR
jgi:hypothetical protein